MIFLWAEFGNEFVIYVCARLPDHVRDYSVIFVFRVVWRGVAASLHSPNVQCVCVCFSHTKYALFGASGGKLIPLQYQWSSVYSIQCDCECVHIMRNERRSISQMRYSYYAQHINFHHTESIMIIFFLFGHEIKNHNHNNVVTSSMNNIKSLSMHFVFYAAAVAPAQKW